jgi:flotillin
MILSLTGVRPIQIEVPLKGALSIENIRVNVPSVFTVAIGTDPETMQNAAIRLLNLNTARRSSSRPATSSSASSAR